MLERATACIAKAGARDTLQCARQTRRASKRLLLPTFWTHGAGDLDPPARSSRSPQRRDDTSLPAAGTTRPLSPALTTDTAFLDFLYPPQALALLRRASRQHVDPRMESGARRQIDGFVQRSRSYSSTSNSDTATYRPFEQEQKQKQSAVQDAGKEHEPLQTNDDEDDFFTHEILGDVGAVHDRNTSRPHGIDSFAPHHAKITEWEKELTGGLDGGSSSASLADSRGGEDGGSEYAYSPGDLAEDEAQRHAESVAASADGDATLTAVEPADRLRRLRQMLAGQTRGNSIEHIRQAWMLYLSLSEHDKQDMRLKAKLLLWLEGKENDLADAYIIPLFWSIPLPARQLTIYSTVAKSFLRQQAWDSLQSMHQEALVNIPNGQELSLQLFAYAIQASRWTRARNVIRDQQKVFPVAEREHRMELFWVKIHEIPDLLEWMPRMLQTPKYEYVHRHRGKAKRGEAWRQEFKVVVSRLSKETVQQAANDLLIKKLDKYRSWKLFSQLNMIVQLDHEVQPFLQGLLTRLIPALGQLYLSQSHAQHTTGLRSDAHEVISFLYWHYRQSKAAKLHPDLMIIWLKHLTRRMGTTDVERRTERNATASMVIEDWQQWHGQIGVEAVHNLIAYSAHAGSEDALRRWTAYLERRHPAYSEQRKAFWAQIYVHARKSNVPAAKKAFEHVSRSARAHGDRLDLMCWKVLLQAYLSADDLEGAIEAFKDLVQTTKLPLDRSVFLPLLNMLCRRGDIDGLEDLMRQSDVFTQEKRSTRSIHEHIRTLTLIDDVPRAELVLAETLNKVRSGDILGSMTECFNTLLGKYASMRDLDATMRAYRRMKIERIYANAATYQHLMQVLANFRRTSAAWIILTRVMPSVGLKPTAVHYRVVMVGFNNQNSPQEAIKAHRHMLENNIRQSLETKGAFVQAEALLERKAYSDARDAGEPLPAMLKVALADLNNSVLGLHARDMTNSGRYSVQDMFAPIMWLLGGERHLTTVRQLFEETKAVAEKLKQGPWPSLRVSTSLMYATYHVKAYSEVEEYWKLVKVQADGIVTPFTIPDFVALREQSLGTSAPTKTQHHHEAAHLPDDRAEVGFVASHRLAVQQLQDAPQADIATRTGPRPAPGRRHILSTPFRIYLASLAAQGRIEDALKEATRLLTQGYTFNNITWNRLVEYIAGSDPPLTLLAFTLTERYLMSNFPGWVSRKVTKHPTRKSARRFHLEHIRARYLGRGELMPQYRTFVWLAKALLELRRREAVGWKGDSQGRKLTPNLERFLGTMKQIREKAPRTLRAVNTMPKLDDKWQNRLLRNTGWKFPPSRSQSAVIADGTLLEASDVMDTTLSGNVSSDGTEASSADVGNAEGRSATSDQGSRVQARDFVAHGDLDDTGEDDVGPMVDKTGESAEDGTDEQTNEGTRQ